MNMTALKPAMCAAFVVARYFNRQESKPERIKQAVLDAELLLKELGIADPTVPAAK